MPDSSCTCRTLAPSRNARSTVYSRPSCGVRRSSRVDSSVASGGSCLVQKPTREVSIDRSALFSASVKLRPSAMASPTLFIVVVSRRSAPGNFSKANRGALTTT